MVDKVNSFTYHTIMNILNIPYKNETLSVKVDDWFYEDYKDQKWNVIRDERDGYINWFFRIRKDGKYLYMHRLVVGAKNTDIADHINGDHFDNRLENLRVVTASQNSMNKRKSSNAKGTKYKGVFVAGNGYSVKIDSMGKRYTVSRFVTEEDAAKEYDRLAGYLFGEYARKNL